MSELVYGLSKKRRIEPAWIDIFLYSRFDFNWSLSISLPDGKTWAYEWHKTYCEIYEFSKEKLRREKKKRSIQSVDQWRFQRKFQEYTSRRIEREQF